MLTLQGLKALLHIALTYILVERLKRLLLWLRLIDELAQRIRQARRAHPILTSSSVGIQAQVTQLLCKLLILKIWLQTMACPSWPRDAWVELLRLIHRVKLLSGCTRILQILQVPRARCLLRKYLRKVQAIHGIHAS